MSVKERPILFSGPMVRALLEGRKTQTRRVLKPCAKNARSFGVIPGLGADFKFPNALEWRLETVAGVYAARPGFWTARVGENSWTYSEPCPYGVPGDQLWVRESFKTSEYRCSEEPMDEDHRCGPHCQQTYVYYAATPREGFRPKPDQARITYLDASTPLTEWYERGWKPSIHMPRWASRITLEVTEVRVQRLQDISVEDVAAEGVPVDWGVPCPANVNRVSWEAMAIQKYGALWEEINGRGSWATNPWVWAISFKVVTP